MPICFQKPEDEILSEYSSHWPTAIGKYVHVSVPFYYHVCVSKFNSPGNVDSNHVFRALSSTLSHALKLQPSMTSWITMKGDLHCGKTAAAADSLR